MEITWAMDALPDDGENFVAVDADTEADATAAADAILDAVVLDAAKVAQPERQEYRLRVAGREMTIWPGRDDDGRVDLAGLDRDLWWLVSAAERR